jgi:crotonobetainyl-CoA:carnitine CoA-transferase CaiB-like acyl-CoA transferase
MSICAALAKRQRDGTGSFLDVSMLETALTAMGWAVSDYLISGRPPARNGNDNVTSSPSGTFKTGDGALNIAANAQRQFEALCRACGCPELIGDLRFRTRAGRKAHRAELTKELEQRLSTRSAAEWEQLLGDAGVPVGRLLSVQESLDQPQVCERELVHDVLIPTSRDRTVSVLGSGVHVDGVALAPSSRPPFLGEHTDDILTEIGYTDDEISAFHSQRAV